MTAAGPCAWSRRILTAAVMALLLVWGPATALADPEPGPTTITVEAEVNDGFEVVATGTLTDVEGNPVPDADVEGHLNGAAVKQGRTNDDGGYSFAFTLPEAARTGEQQLMVSFEGRDQLDASQATTSFPAEQPKPEPADTRLDVFLDVAIAPATLTAGGLVTIEGTLTDENDAPIEGARLTVLLDDEESQDSRVQSSESGSFQTFVEIPADRAAGGTSLVVSFAGNDSFTPGFKRFDVTVEDFAMDDGSTPSVSPTDTAEAEETAAAEANTPATAEAVDFTSTDADSSDLSWFYVALIVVGGGGLLAVGALAFRSRYGRGAHELAQDEQDLDLLLIPDPEAEGEEGAFLSATFGDVEGEDLDDPEATQEIPRRDLD